jgi:hypothetical protein
MHLLKRIAEGEKRFLENQRPREEVKRALEHQKLMRDLIEKLPNKQPICDLSEVKQLTLNTNYDFIEPFKKQPTFLYLCQTDTYASVEKLKLSIPETEFRKLKILTFKDEVDDCIFYPKSTWTTGRNKLIEWAKTQPEYDYYFMIDDDIIFKKGSYDRVEYEVSQLRPLYYSPELTDFYYNYRIITTPSEDIVYKDITYFLSIWTDAIFSCFSKKVFFDEFILPYEERYDPITWWISQGILFYKFNYKYLNSTIVSRTCIVENDQHREYPRNCDIFTSLNDYFGNIPLLSINPIPKNDKCVIITTINPPNKQIDFYSKLKGYDLIIVADTKTDINSYENTKCIMIDLPMQKRISPKLYSKIPFQSYTRKMFGYLYAFANNYDIIYETDDDNIYKNADLLSIINNKQELVTNKGFTNVYNFYTDKLIWPRGIPPDDLKSISEKCITEPTQLSNISVYQGLVDKDPDVDAVYRLTYKDDTYFDKKLETNLVLDKFSVCPFNSQNTFWVDKSMYYSMYFPITVTFRYTDILRGFISLFQMWKHNKTIAFTPPTALQERNQHDLEMDKISEMPMYETAEKVCSLLKDNFGKCMFGVYQDLMDNNIVQAEELDCLKIWMDKVNKLVKL